MLTFGAANRAVPPVAAANPIANTRIIFSGERCAERKGEKMDRWKVNERITAAKMEFSMQTGTTEATLDDDGAPGRERETKIGGERSSESAQ